jgi:hypothetical protein
MPSSQEPELQVKNELLDMMEVELGFVVIEQLLATASGFINIRQGNPPKCRRLTQLD